MPVTREILNEFQRLLGLLSTQYPGSIAEAEHLAETVVELTEADKSNIWRHIWTKALYANMRVKRASALVEMLEQYLPEEPTDLGQWQAQWQVDYQRSAGAHWAAPQNYEYLGASVQDARNRTRIAGRRLFAIYSAGCSVINWDRQEVDRLAAMPLAELLTELQGQFGTGWGKITVAHFLTDLGLAIKPDVHLVRTVCRTGLYDWHPGRANQVPSARRILEIILIVDELNRVLNPNLNGIALRRRLRWLDKVLMEISIKGLLGP